MAYKIAVVTPFHNVKMDLFEKCEAAMRSQSIGFENVEWVIVVHNSEPHYLPELQERFANDPNVVIEPLTDNHRTPSSPRNYGLKFVTAPMVGFLDGDDYYTQNCLEEVVKNVAETGADVVNVRRECIEKTKSNVQLKILSLFNNTERRIVMDQGHWRTDMIFNMRYGISTAYFIDMSLIRTGLAFNNEILMAEDYMFIIQCLARSKRICFLNQLIGYEYIMNDGSLLQSKKSAALVQTYAQGFKEIFEELKKCGVDNRMTIILLLSLLAIFIVNCPDMTLEIRRKIKELLLPYLTDLTSLKPNKAVPEDVFYLKLSLIYEVIFNPERTIESIIQDQVAGVVEMRKILSVNKNTDIGLRNGFESINLLDAYQFRMPLTDAAFYKPLVDLQSRVGEVNLLTHHSPILYFRTATDVLVPCTEEHWKPYHEAVDTIVSGHHNLFLSQSKPIEGTTADEAEIDTLGSALVKAYFQRHYMKAGRITARFASSIENYFAQGEGDDSYQRMAAESLADTESDQIVAFTCEEVVDFFRYLEQHWQQLVEMAPCSESRKAELKAIFEGGFAEPIATKIWPKLQKVVAFGSGEHYPACEEMKKYTGTLTHNHGYYFTEEAILAKASADESNLFECVRGDNFYELIPLKEESAPVLWTQVVKGAPYQLVVTNKAGLYRYTTEHFICPQEVTRESILFTIY